MTTMIEKVAEAIYDRMLESDCIADFGLPKHDALLAAKAAIEAMREPSEGMLAEFGEYDRDWIKRYYEPAIDAALKEE